MNTTELITIYTPFKPCYLFLFSTLLFLFGIMIVKCEPIPKEGVLVSKSPKLKGINLLCKTYMRQPVWFVDTIFLLI